MSVPSDEKLTYYINSKSGFSKERMEVSYRAFYPTKKRPTELSVYRISTLIANEDKIWEIGRKYVEGNRKIKARADFSASIFYENDFFLKRNIKVISTPNSHELHADIIPIPINKEDRDELFRVLAPLCELVIRPEDH